MTVKIVQYEWAGKKWFWKIKSHCGECDLTKAMLDSMMKNEFKGKDVTFEIKPWLDNIFYCLFRLAWHPPIVMVNGRKFHQFSHKDPLFNKKKLEQLVLKKLKH